MRKAICNVAITGCLALPLALLGAKRPSRAPEGSDGQRIAKLARKIQKAVAKDQSFSTAGRDIDVIFEKHIIILKGLVASDEESQAIQGKAESFVIQATPDQQIEKSLLFEVDNELVVARR